MNNVLNKKVEEGKIICPECGQVIDEVDAVEVNGELYCRDCVVECPECGDLLFKTDGRYCEDDGKYYCGYCADILLTLCDRCNEWHFNDGCYGVRVEGWRRRREVWCEACVEDYAYYCADCDEYYDSECGITDREGRHICPDCADDYVWCDECEEYVHCDDYDDDEGMCCRCADSVSSKIKSYHSGGAVKYNKIGDIKKAWRGVWRGVGVELEVERRSDDADYERNVVERLHNIYKNMVFERDGSLEDGFEIITSPHTVEAFYNMPWGEMLSTLSEAGYQSHDGGRCGLHMHLSREFFGSTVEKQNTAIAKLMRFFDIYYGDIVKVSRRDDYTAKRWSAPHDTTSNADARSKTKKGIYDRYRAVNISNSATVEIRIMRGTLNIKSFLACCDFIITTAKNSRRVKWTKIANAGEWLNGLKPETVEYIKSRNAFIDII